LNHGFNCVAHYTQILYNKIGTAMQSPMPSENEPARLAALHGRSLLDTQPEERFDRLTRLARYMFGVQIALVSLVDAQRQWFKSRQGLDVCETGRDVSFCGHAVLNEGIFHIPDARSDPRFADNPLVTGAPFIRFYAGAPLTTTDGFRIGTLCLIDSSPRQLNASELLALRDLADCVQGEINRSSLEQQRLLLQKESEGLRHILESSPVSVRIMRLADKKLVFVNQSFCNMVRFPKEQVIGMDPSKFYRRIEDYQALSARLQRGEPVINYPIELTSQGHDIWGFTSFFNIEFEGEAASLAWIYDVTQLVEARKDAERANHAKSEFLSNMSHELRTPMNAVLGFGQLLQYDDTLNAQQQESVQHILKGGNHLLELINQVLDLARVEAGHLSLSLEPVEVNSVVQECRSLVSALAEKRNITISYSGLEGVVVRADRTRLKQVLFNLLSNAIKYNREGGRVTLDVQAAGEQRLHLRVTDTGAGIPAERLEELFQPFNRLGAEKSAVEGTGIGLTITRRIMQAMGGTVDVQSTPGVGSTFWVELPQDTLAGAEHQAAPISNGLAPAAQPVAVRHTVLYIEDNPVNIKLVDMILSRRKYIRLIAAHTPEIGVELAQTLQPDLILLDINMPGMNGYQVLEVFKSDAKIKSIPVIAVTANAMLRDIQRGKAAGFADYLTKPLMVTQFLETIDRHLK
jgi:PAS domain S-box-containing protein